MSDVFVSHSSKDKEMAQKIQEQLKAKGATAFVASTSVGAGEKWSDEIKARLKESEWVLFLATPNSCASPAVNQELGGSWLAGKPIIPLLCGVRAEQLPGWAKEYQAVDLTEEPERADGIFTRIAQFLERKKLFQWLVGGILVGVIVWVLVKAFRPAWVIGGLLLFSLAWLALKPTSKRATC